MKKFIGIFSILCLSLLVFSCSKSDNPADNDLFVGTYNGSIAYKDQDSNISTKDGSVTVVKVGKNYNFRFNKSGIPNLTGVKFKKNGDQGIINVDFKEGITVVQISASKLVILYTKDDQVWTANCTR